ncbi:uncharacterized protein RAG0_05437 [Rhynchosporium agropyri]|uniref:Uncharacterized protein n=1 Tax=Rhynchosporium agropyri TaxID=914238 RepID=A0A1E1KD35_9HELO|nr:uncharacterized protein RAG0_05437 [Rhynchosporium agropyri]
MKRPRIDVAVASIIYTANSQVDGKGASQEEKWREGERGLSITGLNVLTLSILTEPDLIGVREISANTAAGGIDRASIRELCCVEGIVAEAIPAADGMRYNLGQQTCATFGCLRGLCLPFFKVYDCRVSKARTRGSSLQSELSRWVRLLKQALPVDEIEVQLMRLPDQVQARGMAVWAEEQKRLGGVDEDQVVERYIIRESDKKRGRFGFKVALVASGATESSLEVPPSSSSTPVGLSSFLQQSRAGQGRAVQGSDPGQGRFKIRGRGRGRGQGRGRAQTSTRTSGGGLLALGPFCTDGLCAGRGEDEVYSAENEDQDGRRRRVWRCPDGPMSSLQGQTSPETKPNQTTPNMPDLTDPAERRGCDASPRYKIDTLTVTSPLILLTSDSELRAE